MTNTTDGNGGSPGGGEGLFKKPAPRAAIVRALREDVNRSASKVGAAKKMSEVLGEACPRT